jgi:hypothetical protein
MWARFDAAIRAELPDAQAESVFVPVDRSYEYRRWRSSKGNINIRSVVADSPKDAEELLLRMRDRPVPSTQIRGFGDHAYLFAPSNPNGERFIILRRGRLILEISAIGESNVRRFAGLAVAEAVKGKFGDRQDRDPQEENW